MISKKIVRLLRRLFKESVITGILLLLLLGAASFLPHVRDTLRNQLTYSTDVVWVRQKGEEVFTFMVSEVRSKWE